MSSSITSSKLLSSTRYTYGWEGTPGSSEAIERVNGVISRRNLAVRRSTPVLFSGAETPTNVGWVDGNWRRFTGAATAPGLAVPTLRFLLNDGQTGISEGVYVGVSCVVGNQTSESQTVSLDLSDNVPTQVTLAPGEIQRLSVGAFATADPYQFVDLALTPKYPRHRWTGTAVYSVSEEILATQARRNLVQDPAPAGGLGASYGSGATASAAIRDEPAFPSKKSWRITWAKGPTDGWNASRAFVDEVTPGTQYTFSMYTRGTRGGARVTVEFIDAQGKNIDGYNSGPAVTLDPVNPQRISVTRTAPAGAVRGTMFFDNGSDVKPGDGDWVETSSMMMEAASAPGAYFDGDTASPTQAAILFRELQIQTGSVGTYFDPSTPARTDNVYASSQPALVTGYQSRRQTQHVFHDVLGGGQDVTMRPASLRSGTLSCLFLTEAEARNCEDIHTGTDVLTFADSDLPSTGMTYVPDGAITRALDSQSRALWTVDIDFREVTP